MKDFKVKKFNEFIDEGFMSRMVDTVYNNKPKKENESFSYCASIVFQKIINSQDFDKIRIEHRDGEDDYFLTFKNTYDIVLMKKELRDIPHSNFKEGSLNGELNCDWMRVFNPLNSSNYITIYYTNYDDSLRLDVSKDILDHCTEEIRSKILSSLDEGFMSRMVDTVYNDKPKKENDTLIDKIAILLIEKMKIKPTDFKLLRGHYKFTHYVSTKKGELFISLLENVKGIIHEHKWKSDYFYDPKSHDEKECLDYNYIIYANFSDYPRHFYICKEVFDSLVEMELNKIKLT